jgi:hypothetical protein
VRGPAIGPDRAENTFVMRIAVSSTTGLETHVEQLVRFRYKEFASAKSRVAFLVEMIYYLKSWG